MVSANSSYAHRMTYMQINVKGLMSNEKKALKIKIVYKLIFTQLNNVYLENNK